MKEQWLQWQTKFDGIELKRRRMWFIVAVIFVLYVSYWFGMRPALETITSEQAKQQGQQAQIDQFSAEVQQLQQLLNADPQANQRRRLEQLQARLLQVSQELNQEANYVSAADNRALLRELLNQAGDVEVQSAQALPAELVYQDEVDQDAGIFRHRLQLVLRGDYASLSRYLQRLEQLTWSFYWQRLDYKVLEPPAAELTIEIYTISLERDYVAS